MFCCTKRQEHYGQIVTSICLEQQCIKSKNQLCCYNCIQEEHQEHSTTTMKKIMPQLLTAHRQKQKYFAILNKIVEFVNVNFGEENNQGQNTTVENISLRVEEILSALKNNLQVNTMQMSKMKDIFKNLNKNAGSNIVQSTIQKSNISQKNQSGKNSPKKYQSPSKLKSNIYSSNQKSNIQQSSIGGVEMFSHTSKHPYLSVSTDQRTLTKSSNSGHKFAAVNCKPLSFNQNQVRLLIDACPSGNIMIGLCHESIVKSHQYINSYGTNHGTYLIGQNNSNPQTAISFHHSLNMMNRKQIVGWNFQEGDQIIVGFNFDEQYIYFKKMKSKQKKDKHKQKEMKSKQFSMALVSEENIHKDQIRQMVRQNGIKLIVMLQNVGDQVTLIQE